MILKVDSVVKHFGTRRILSDVHLSCSVGEIVGIFGRNGSGKSTLLKIIFGSISAENAYVNIDGKTLSNRFHRSKKVAYLFQDSFLPQDLKVSTLLSLLKIESIDQAFVEKIKGLKINQLSGGELRYLEILFVLNSDRKFVILDEPFNGLSPILKDVVKEEIVRFSRIKGIILTDHDYRNVLSITTKNYLMTQGVMRQVQSKEDLVQANYLPFDS